jgi:hypothetical protein
MDSYNSPTTKPIFRGTQIVWYILGLLEILLAFRFVLKLAAANAGAGFSSFIYNVTWPFAQPFVSVFGRTQVGSSSVEWTTLLAMVVYALIAWGIVKLLLMGKTVSTPEAAAKLNESTS